MFLYVSMRNKKVETIYADYAATHITKPECVKDAVMNALALGNKAEEVSMKEVLWMLQERFTKFRTKVDRFF